MGGSALLKSTLPFLPLFKISLLHSLHSPSPNLKFPLFSGNNVRKNLPHRKTRQSHTCRRRNKPHRSHHQWRNQQISSLQSDFPPSLPPCTLQPPQPPPSTAKHLLPRLFLDHSNYPHPRLTRLHRRHSPLCDVQAASSVVLHPVPPCPPPQFNHIRRFLLLTRLISLQFHSLVQKP